MTMTQQGARRIADASMHNCVVSHFQTCGQWHVWKWDRNSGLPLGGSAGNTAFCRCDNDPADQFTVGEEKDDD